MKVRASNGREIFFIISKSPKTCVHFGVMWFIVVISSVLWGFMWYFTLILQEWFTIYHIIAPCSSSEITQRNVGRFGLYKTVTEANNLPIGVCFGIQLQWRHNERDGVWNHQNLDGLLSRLSRRTLKKISKLCANGLCEGNPSVTGGLPLQMATNAENSFIWWCHHVFYNVM